MRLLLAIIALTLTPAAAGWPAPHALPAHVGPPHGVWHPRPCPPSVACENPR